MSRRIRRAKHNLSHYHITSADMGQLIPIEVREVLPGESFRHGTNAIIRTSPLNTPVMHPVHITVHHWFVPHRIVWPDFEKFVTGGPDGEDATVLPKITAPTTTGFSVGSLANRLGVVAGVDDISVNALPFRAYAMIWNHFYRDQQLQTPLTVATSSGPDTTTNTALQNVCWEKDYFTAARPEAQLGPDVYLPLGQTAPVHSEIGSLANGGPHTVNTTFPAGDRVTLGALSTNSDLYADLSNASAVTILQLRQTSAIQRFMEQMNNYGARFDEYLMSQFGVRSQDSRLQLPEYLGGSTQVLQFSEVLQTAEGADPVGEMRGHGIAALNSNAYTRFFQEHGYIISLAFVRPKTMYFQGLERHWSYSTKYDFFQPQMETIGDQEVYNREIFVQGTAADNNIFGWSPRYEQYRRAWSKVSAEMETVLDTWHMCRDFSGAPALNADFVKCNPTDRIFASSTNNTLYMYFRHSMVKHSPVAKRAKSVLR